MKYFQALMTINTIQKMKFSVKDFFSRCDQIYRKLQIWSRLLKKSLMENFIFCAVLKVGGVLQDIWKAFIILNATESQEIY